MAKWNPFSSKRETDQVQEPDPLTLLQRAEKPSFASRLRTWFLTGLVVAAPIWITLYVAAGFIDFVDGFVANLLPARYNPNEALPFSIPGLGLLVMAILLTLTGFLTANFVGRRALSFAEEFVSRMPVIRTIYGGLKQIFETAVSQSERSFTKAVLVEYPRKGLWAMAFVTSDSKGEVGSKAGKAAAKLHDSDWTAEAMVNVFLPTTPNPTSGFLLFVPKRDVIELDMSIEDAAKMIISAGMVTPDALPVENGNELEDDQPERQ
ncbi:MAG: DUF502 domain-containing protein [Alphaproteobacteria bacterium]